MAGGVIVTGGDGVARKLVELEAKLRAKLTREVNKGAFLIHKDATMSVQRGAKTGIVYTRGNSSHQASAPGEAPAAQPTSWHRASNPDEPQLGTSITFEVDADGLGAAVKTGNSYAPALEFGTSKMAARPFMHPAFEKNRAAISDLIRAAYDAAKPS